MSRFKFIPGGGYQYGGEAGDYAAACPLCTQHFEGPTADIVEGAAAACAENDRRGTDLYDTPRDVR
ncbi:MULTISPECIES: hypothetical protein [Pseudonocardia]|uniref:Uncharacterized protein n=2 Tax=Pseudonocardia TaxID=1847 RepID=A0A1Y2MLT0_PSEAH|nr:MULTISPECIES: hypothetical protein [Pseudonocardia]OSY36102.1 hypothetical protein BG845_05617 [Pseudonocardia autotrophica]TDN77584.1 hypothetical protein C8E95_6833 [Pseudonocardia autotrophica]BBG01614.1 hypothetical protein Pdca_28230 [Pseudonocardia autotrophica]GEC25359.1 hypothetical protein PSA01_23880 [Pseudonocardia saturnea]